MPAKIASYRSTHTNSLTLLNKLFIERYFEPQFTLKHVTNQRQNITFVFSILLPGLRHFGSVSMATLFVLIFAPSVMFQEKQIAIRVHDVRIIYAYSLCSE